MGLAAAASVLVAMAGTHGVDVWPVAVKRTMALASRTYGEDRMREREREEMHMLWLATGELMLGDAPRPWQRRWRDNVALPVLV